MSTPTRSGTSNGISSAELKARVVAHALTMELDRDPWEKAPFLTALLRQGSPDGVDVARRVLNRAVDTQTSAGHLNYHDRLFADSGHLRVFTPTSLSGSLGYPLLLLYELEGDARVLEAAQREVHAVLAAPRTADGGITFRYEAPELWIDFTYLLIPFMVKAGLLTDDIGLIDEAVHQLTVHIDRLVDRRTGLCRHVWCERPDHYPQSTFWLRGQGWLASCIVDVLALAGERADAAPFREVLGAQFDALLSLQDRSGYWRHIVDDPTERFESSGTLILAYAIAKAVNLGLRSIDDVRPAESAFAVVAGSVDDDGKVPGVAIPPGGPGVPFGSAAFAQGFFLLAEHELALARR